MIKVDLKNLKRMEGYHQLLEEYLQTLDSYPKIENLGSKIKKSIQEECVYLNDEIQLLKRQYDISKYQDYLKKDEYYKCVRKATYGYNDNRDIEIIHILDIIGQGEDTEVVYEEILLNNGSYVVCHSDTIKNALYPKQTRKLRNFLFDIIQGNMEKTTEDDWNDFVSMINNINRIYNENQLKYGENHEC